MLDRKLVPIISSLEKKSQNCDNSKKNRKFYSDFNPPFTILFLHLKQGQVKKEYLYKTESLTLDVS